ncbi:PREDICTED: putative F-box/LRR-repeat protein 23 [Ipomoea nil]|uniref:putative F-box/LRR-repeat protein 23 n=1 Tax=Ipomoea nil TaxID=35883 RepID=UPI0009010C12|nr:PREDICTED: putative F-box/LRR-repeat protein 23 [Ipomoea nil]
MPKRYTYYRQKKFVWRFPKKKNPADASSSNPPPPPPPWVELPRDITANILHRLGTIDVLQTALKVCSTWRSVCLDPAMWRVIDMSSSDDDHLYSPALKPMCRYAVDLSQGQLVDITIEEFGTDDLVLYIAQRANQLRRLQLVSCINVSSECLCKAATEFPLLQELQIHFSNISSEGIKVVGRSCPSLNSFTFDQYGSMSPMECDDDALAIAENMHGLHHLSLFGNKITNKGVQAILDGCPHLESLDLRRCSNVTLEGDLGVRCSQRIKNLRCPNDSTSDYEFCDYVEDDDDYYGLYLSDGFPDYYDYDYDDFAYDDYTDPFSHEYLELDDDYPSIPLGWLV